MRKVNMKDPILKTEGKYILDKKGKPKKEKDLLKWGRWLQKAGKKRIVKQTTIDHFFVSTVFLGLDHNFRSNEAPLLFETMVFDKNRVKKTGLPKKLPKKLYAWEQLRYETRKNAESGHKLTVQQVKSYVSKRKN